MVLMFAQELLLLCEAEWIGRHNGEELGRHSKSLEKQRKACWANAGYLKQIVHGLCLALNDGF